MLHYAIVILLQFDVGFILSGRRDKIALVWQTKAIHAVALGSSSISWLPMSTMEADTSSLTLKSADKQAFFLLVILLLDLLVSLHAGLI